MATIILGSQWGDEGKGKMTDILCPNVEICARAAGGHNAGHSIHANGVSYDFHLLPSGLINPKCYNLIGSAVVFHVPSFFKELAELEKKGLSHVRDRIFVSDRCHVNLDLHAAVDGLEEAELGTRKIGTTGRGIGPSYSTKAARSGIRIHDIFDADHFESKLRFLYNGYRKRFGDLLQYDVEDELARFRQYREELPRYVIDAVPFMAQAQETKKKILVEGANALMLDVDWGTYPYITSSSTCLGGIISGLAISPRNIDNIVGIVKAYTTRVGAGIFPTEDTGDVGNKLQEIGREFGVTTGRRRRCGWLDLVVLKHSTLINHYTILNLTKLDVLDTFETLKVCVGYKGLNGEEVEGFPADLAYLEKCTPVYRELKGWNTPTTAIKTFDALPKEAQEYIKVIEDFVNVKVGWIGTGPDREDMIRR